MATKSKDISIEEINIRMKEHLTVLGYTEIAEDLNLVQIDPDNPETGKLAAMEANEVVIFCYPVGGRLAQKVAFQDEGVFWSRLVEGDLIAHFVWVSDGEFDYFFDNNKNTSISELPEKANWRDVVRGISYDRKKHLIELSQEFARGNYLDNLSTFI